MQRRHDLDGALSSRDDIHPAGHVGRGTPPFLESAGWQADFCHFQARALTLPGLEVRRRRKSLKAGITLVLHA